MNQRASRSPFGSLLELTSTSAALMAGLVLLLVALVRGGGMMLMMDQARGGNVAFFGMFSAVMALVSFVIAATVQFMLSRRIGDARSAAHGADMGAWLAFTVLYWLVTSIVTSALPLGIIRLGMAGPMMGIVMSATALVLSILFFPLIVYLVGLARGGNRASFGQIVGFLAGEGLVWFACYLAIAIFAIALPMGLNAMAGLIGFGPGGSVMLIGAAAGAVGQWLRIVMAIATYEAVVGQSQVPDQVFS